ncbi:hypothetical protein LPJ70_000641 [Coemansia sp. RSA 2708]|nr:hypothetical protein LPJ70_000641 [Coemansia sp. RSA 2708]
MANSDDAANKSQPPPTVDGMLPDLEAAGDLSSGNFPFPLTDQASLFNFHTPAGLGIGSFGLGSGQDILGGGIGASAAGGTADDMAVNMALLESIGRNDSLAYSTAASMPFSQSAAAVPTPDTLAGAASSDALLQPTSMASGAVPDTLADDSTMRMRIARARMLNNMLYNMSFGGIQQLDGYHHGSMAMPPAAGMDDVANITGPGGLNPMLAGASAPNPLNLLSAYSQDAGSYPLISPLSPVSPFGVASQAAATITTAAASSTASQPRVDQACKMCRRRKVRCDGRRPRCTFCTSKNFACVYEPVTSGTRKRGRKGKTAGGTSVISNASGPNHPNSVRSESCYSDDNRQPTYMGSDAGNDRFGKQRRFSGRIDTMLDDIGESPEDSELDSAEASSSEADPKHGYLDALSNRQIALPDSVSAEFSLQSIIDSRADMEIDEGVAAATLASIGGDQQGKGSGAQGAAEPTDKPSTAADNKPVSAAERHMRQYFEYFHPQHPILHRDTFEKAVHEGTVNKVLWHAVQAIAARYGPPPPEEALAKGAEKENEDAMAIDDEPGSVEESSKPRASRELRPYEYGKRYAELVRALLPEAARRPTIEVIQALYLLSEHQFGMGDWLEGSSYWGTAVRMFNQLQLHMTDEAFQFPAYTSHLGLHESAISPLTCKQSPAHYASEMRKPTLNNESWIRREMERRMRWALLESERMHSLAGGNPPLVTLEAGWVHMPCSDEIWEMANPRRAAEYERLLLHMGRYYVDTGGSLRIDMAPESSAPASKAASATDSVDESSDASGEARRKSHPASTPNRVASMLVSVRRRKNRIHLNAHTAIVIGQMTRARLALFRLFFPCRWPSQLMSTDLFGAGHERSDLGGGGGAPGPVVLSWEERFRRMRVTISDIEGKLMQWRVYLESMFPLREHEEGSGRTDDENRAIHRERVEYANYRFMLAGMLIQNRSTVLQLQACLARRERKIKNAGQEPNMDEAAKQTLANHILPNQPSEQAMKSLRAYGQECWNIIVRQACEIEDLLESHWQVRPNANPSLRVMIKPDWHAQDAISAKINADTNLRMFPKNAETGERDINDDLRVHFSHETPPYPLLVVNQRLLAAVIKSADSAQKQEGAELTLASSMNSNIHIETNANARDLGRSASLGLGRQKSNRQARVSSGGSSSQGSSSRRRVGSGPCRPRFALKDSGEVDFESDDESETDAPMDPFRMQFNGTSYFMFLAAKTLIMYLHHAKMSAYILARRRPGANGSECSDDILPSSSVSVNNDRQSEAAAAGSEDAERAQETMLLPEFVEDLSPPPQLRTLADIRRMQDRLEVVLTALRTSQKYWMGVDYFVLCARKLRNMAIYGPWRTEDPVSTDISSELANGAWPPHFQQPGGFGS